ncbi:E3 ubiquitin-protein ligase PPP1R11 [Drosophila elegans]|uniref:E3 ubiquitin-protein ligase PPP1R11 n=1 Tax=Drosophila elegans TaxID=30023 RepID=UPI0007E661A4|nr:E3 ubiquitin-protein ligase PPP1R11 [Drosophila elegans]
MDQQKTTVSTIDAETEPWTIGKVTKTTRKETDSGFSSAGSTDSVHQVHQATPCQLRLRLAQKEPTEKRVGFHAGVIDNEHMNRRKSKCCCIYRKPHPFGESSSSTDDECEHCFGHPEVKARNRLEKQRRKMQQSCCCCCCDNHHHQHQDNRNNRLPMEGIAGEKDNNQAEEEPEAVINESGGEELKEK